MDKDYSDKIRKAIVKYNRYRSPEAVARVIKREGNLVYVKIEGTYCETCGLYDWIEDLKYVFEEYGLISDIIDIKNDEPSFDYRIAVFKIKNQ
ncbi:hypothetical protein Calag_0599 [Caldisphaera lagunensis DSM 15908]|uniref:Uncharacterized protein n=1 Tax=Caldisphaera lagunensis (strain DSM 15908 / JCM 11604 / ANMR 0165 / IC-154) TaxID=1056495 RepID=L0A915_CALLD|nr:hypothetical protein [Caldisphaera lagunensis]AFZ70356.1 hypothetical protein Calag_0599 [Caldisphaera lagunensis DSM 15908]